MVGDKIVKPKKSIKKIKIYNRPDENRKNKIRLDLNENVFGCSKRAINALKKIDSDDISIYPEYNNFEKKLASFLKIKPNELLLTNGTDDAIKVVMDTFLDKNEEIIIPSPTFRMFEIYASVIDAKITQILYNKDMSFPTEKVLKNINSKTKMIILVNPNNPTGSIIENKDILKIIEKAKNAIVMIDEAYFQFYAKSSKNLIKSYDNVIILQTFSKAFGLAGIRLGYVISNAKIINELKKVILPYTVNSLSIIAASAALDDKNFVNNYVKKINYNRYFISKEFKKLGLKVFPSYTNFVIVNFGKKYKLVYEKLKDKNILVRDISNYPLSQGCLRISIGTKEQCNKLIFEVKNILKNKALLFDMDGVLVDVSRSYRSAIKKTAEFFLKQKINYGEIQEFKEKGGFNDDWDLTEAIILSRKMKIPKNSIIKKFQEYYLGDSTNKGLMDNEKWLLSQKQLKELNNKFKLGIVTGRPKKEAFYILNKVNVVGYFDIIITRADVPKNKAKPHPYPLNLALKKLDLSHGFYIGDNIDDLKAAKKAKLEFIGVVPPNISSSNMKKSFKEMGAKKIINDINKISEVLN